MLKILLVKTSSMGDLIHNMPMIADIHAHFPDAIMDWVVEESFAEIAALNPLVNQLIPVTMRRWKRTLTRKSTWSEFLAFKRHLKAHTYDAILDTQGLLKSAMICHWANGPSHGASKNTTREPLAGYIYTHSYDISQQLHAIVRNRLVAAQALGYPLPHTPPVYDIKIPETSLPENLPTHFVMGLHGTARDAKLWPVDFWVALGQYLASQGLSLLLPWGNESERLRAESIAAQTPLTMVLPKMRLTQLTSLTSKAQAAVGVDTGLMHLAVALNIPTLAIFTDTEIWQAGAMPAAGSLAITLGGKLAMPSVDEAIKAIKQLLPRS